MSGISWPLLAMIGGGVVVAFGLGYALLRMFGRASRQAGAGEVKIDTGEKAIEVTNEMNKKILESHSTEDTEEDLRKGGF